MKKYNKKASVLMIASVSIVVLHGGAELSVYQSDKLND